MKHISQIVQAFAIEVINQAHSTPDPVNCAIAHCPHCIAVIAYRDRQTIESTATFINLATSKGGTLICQEIIFSTMTQHTDGSR